MKWQNHIMLFIRFWPSHNHTQLNFVNIVFSFHSLDPVTISVLTQDFIKNAFKYFSRNWINTADNFNQDLSWEWSEVVHHPPTLLKGGREGPWKAISFWLCCFLGWLFSKQAVFVCVWKAVLSMLFLHISSNCHFKWSISISQDIAL